MVEEYLSHVEAKLQAVTGEHMGSYHGDVTANDLNNWALSAKTCALVNSKMLKVCNPGKKWTKILERNKKFAIMTTDTSCYPSELNINEPSAVLCLNDSAITHEDICIHKVWHKQFPVTCPSCWSSLRIPFKYVTSNEAGSNGEGPRHVRKHKLKKMYRNGLKKNKSILHRSMLPCAAKSFQKDTLSHKRQCSRLASTIDIQKEPKEGVIICNKKDDFIETNVICENTDNGYVNVGEDKRTEINVKREHTYAIPTLPRGQLPNASTQSNTIGTGSLVDIDGECMPEKRINDTLDNAATSDQPGSTREMKILGKKKKSRKIQSPVIRWQHQQRMTSRGRILKVKQKYLD